MSKEMALAKGGSGKGGGKRGGSPSNPNWPSKTGGPSGGGRGNNHPVEKITKEGKMLAVVAARD